MERVLDLTNEGYIAAVEMSGAGVFREEIVRCRDCKHSKRYNGSWLCLLFHVNDADPVYIESWTYLETRSDGFCAWAERRES